MRRITPAADPPYALNPSYGLGSRKSQAAISFLVSKLSSISTLLGSRRKICQRGLSLSEALGQRALSCQDT